MSLKREVPFAREYYRACCIIAGEDSTAASDDDDVPGPHTPTPSRSPPTPVRSDFRVIEHARGV